MKIQQSDNCHLKQNFKALKPIPKKAYKIGAQALKESFDDLVKAGNDADIEVIGKIGPLSKVKCLIFFVTKIGKKKGEWATLSIDPKGYMPTEHRYKTVDKFTKEDILSSVDAAKKRLFKKNSELPRPFLGADAILLAKFVNKFTKKCSI